MDKAILIFSVLNDRVWRGVYCQCGSSGLCVPCEICCQCAIHMGFVYHVDCMLSVCYSYGLSLCCGLRVVSICFIWALCIMLTVISVQFIRALCIMWTVVSVWLALCIMWAVLSTGVRFIWALFMWTVRCQLVCNSYGLCISRGLYVRCVIHTGFGSCGLYASSVWLIHMDCMHHVDCMLPVFVSLCSRNQSEGVLLCHKLINLTESLIFGPC